MRTAAELNQDLDREAKKFATLFLVFRSNDKIKSFVFAADRDRFAKVEDDMRQGGDAIGMIGATDDGTEIHFYKKLFSEYADDEWAERLLNIVRDVTVLELSGRRIRPVIERDGWPD